MNDWELIQRYAVFGEEQAFAELVRRYLAFVHASARRQVGPDQASDVAQAVFLILARKAPSLNSRVVLSSWLFRTTRFVAAQSRRAEGRRVRRESQLAEEEAVVMSPSNTSEVDAPVSLELERHLDDAMASLAETDRRYVLTRFFEKRRFSDIAERFGVSEEAAKKRVARALERMRLFLLARGVVVGSAALGAWLLSPRAEAVPAGLTATIAASVIRLSGTSGSVDRSAAVDRLMDQGLRGWRSWSIRRAGTWSGVAVGLGMVVAGWIHLLSVSSRPDRSAGSVVGITTEGEVAVRANAKPGASRQAARWLDLRVVSEATGAEVSGAQITWGLRRGTDWQGLGLFLTATNGQCRLEIPEVPFEFATASVSASNFVPVEMNWQPYEFGSGGAQSVCRLVPGRTLQGSVRDVNGQAVAGVRVSLAGQLPRPTGRREATRYELQCVTDTAGRFQLAQVPVSMGMALPSLGRCFGSLSASHPDFVEAVRMLNAPSDLLTNQDFVLQPARRGYTVRGQVVDPDGVPVAGARVTESGGTELVTDTMGLFVIADAAARSENASLQFEVQASGYARYPGYVHVPGPVRETGRLLADSDGVRRFSGPESPEMNFVREHVLLAPVEPGVVDDSVHLRIRLRVPVEGSNDREENTPLRSLRLAGEVVDDATGVPVPHFRVTLGMPGLFVGEGTGGSFDWELQARVPEMITVNVYAEGYLPQGESLVHADGPGRRMTFRLRSSELIQGWVETPEGRPAVGARITLRTAGLSLGSEPGKPVDWLNLSSPVAVTRAQGAFEIERRGDDEALAVLHPSGWAVYPAFLAKGSIIRLEAWASVEGELSGEDPGRAAVKVTIAPVLGEVWAGATESVGFRGYRVPDAHGRFRFEAIPGGFWTLRVEDAQGAEVRSMHVNTRAGRVARVRFQDADGGTVYSATAR